MTGIRPFIRKIALRTPFIAQVYRRLEKACIHPLFTDDRYFFKAFSNKTNPYNIDALNLTGGITSGAIDGKKYIMQFEPGNYLESTIYKDGLWEPHLIGLMNMFLQRSQGIMLDVGANIGATTIPLAVNNPHIHFHCYEPHPAIFKRLQQNLQLNLLSNVSSMQCAISDAPQAHIPFYADKNTKNTGLSSVKLNHDIGAHDVINVPVMGIDTMHASGERVALIKIDTQGSEPEVLKSAQQTIATHRPIIFFEFEDEYYPSEKERAEAKYFIMQFFAGLNYTLVGLNPVINYYPTIDLTKKYHGDVLAIPLPNNIK